MRAEKPVHDPELGAFWSGAVGYFSYDVARTIERLPSPPPRAIDAPDALFVFSRTLLILDNLRGLGRIVVATSEIEVARARATMYVSAVEGGDDARSWNWSLWNAPSQ